MNARKNKKKFLHIDEAARYIGVAAVTLRRWDEQGKLTPARRTLGGWRLYTMEQLDQAGGTLWKKR